VLTFTGYRLSTAVARSFIELLCRPTVFFYVLRVIINNNNYYYIVADIAVVSCRNRHALLGKSA